MRRLVYLQFFGVITETFDPWEHPKDFVHPLRSGVKEMLNRIHIKVATPEIVLPNSAKVRATLRQGTEVYTYMGGWKDWSLRCIAGCVTCFIPLERRDAEIQFERQPPRCCRASVDRWEQELQSAISREAYQRAGWSSHYPRKYVTMIGASAARLQSSYDHGSRCGLFVAEETSAEDVETVNGWDFSRVRVLRTMDEVADFILAPDAREVRRSA